MPANDIPSRSEFRGWRAIFWPIHTRELKKFIPMTGLMSLVLFAYTMVRNGKDSLLVNAPGSGSEALSFAKLIFTTPSAVLVMILYNKAAGIVKKENLIYVALSPFVVFFTSFAIFLYPNTHYIHASADTIARLGVEYPRMRWIISLLGNWSYTMFYVLSETLGTIGILSFWQLANEITSINEAKRLYGLYGMFGNVGLLLAGAAPIAFDMIYNWIRPPTDAWSFSVQCICGSTVLSLLGMMLIYRWIQLNVLTDPLLFDASSVRKKEKPTLSFKESLKYVTNSPYLLRIFLLIASYGALINIVEGTWKSQMKIAFQGDRVRYNKFMGQFSAATGITTIVLMFVGNNILRRFSWRSAALITPVALLVSGSAFFFFVVCFRNDPSFMIGGFQVVFVSVWIGFVQNSSTKGFKYAIYDPLKEMAYIPIDVELRIRGKAAAEIVGGRFGKGFGAGVQIAMFTATGLTLQQLSPAMGMIFLGGCGIFIYSVTSLSTRYEIARAAAANSTPQPPASSNN